MYFLRMWGGGGVAAQADGSMYYRSQPTSFQICTYIFITDLFFDVINESVVILSLFLYL